MLDIKDKIFQAKFLTLMVENKNFLNQYRKSIEKRWFDYEDFQIVAECILNYYDTYNRSPSFNDLKVCLYNYKDTDRDKDFWSTLVDGFQSLKEEGLSFVHDHATKFIQYRVYKETIRAEAEYLENYDFDSIQRAQKEALKYAVETEPFIDFFEDDPIEFFIQDEIRDTIPTGISALDEVLRGGTARGEISVIMAAPSRGKAQPLWSKVLSSKGWVNIGDVKEGDFIYTQSGRLTRVNGVFPQGKKSIYKISTRDRGFTFCCGDHLWETQTPGERRYNKSSVKTTKEIKSRLYSSDGKLWHRLPKLSPIEFNYKPTPIDPYLLGVLISEGGLSGGCVRFSSNNKNIVEECRKSIDKSSGLDINLVGKNTKSDTYSISGKGIGYSNYVLSWIKFFGLDKKSYKKFIPDIYKINSVEVRKRLLSGLLDGDGEVSKDNRIFYSSSSKELIDDIDFIVKSLGGHTFYRVKPSYYTYKGKRHKGKDSHLLQINLDFNPFLAENELKRGRFNIKSKIRSNYRYIKNVEYYGEEECVCISVEDESSLYVTDDFLLTHNTTSLINLGYGAVMSGHRVYHFHAEQMSQVIQARYMSRFLGVNYADLKTKDAGEIDKRLELWNQIIENNGDLIINKCAGGTIGSIRSFVYKHGYPDVIIIDYADKLVPKNRYSERRHEIASIYDEMVMMADEFNCSILTASQTHREALNKEKVDIHNLAESYEKAAIADNIFAICCTEEEVEQNKFRLRLVKVRNEEGHREIPCKIYPRKMKIIADEALFRAFGKNTGQYTG